MIFGYLFASIIGAISIAVAGWAGLEAFFVISEAENILQQIYGTVWLCVLMLSLAVGSVNVIFLTK